MNTLDLNQAAAFLKMTPEGVRRLAASKKLPAAKPGKCWCFLETDLVEYLRALYASSCKASQGDNHRRTTLCHSLSETISGGYDLVIKDSEYSKVLGLPTK